MIILELLNASPDHSTKTITIASALDASFAWSLDKCGTTCLVYFTEIRCKEAWIGGSTVLQTLVLCCLWFAGPSGWTKRPSEPSFIRMKYRQADLHTQAHCLMCITHVHTNKTACIHAYTHLQKKNLSTSPLQSQVCWPIWWAEIRVFTSNRPQLVPTTSRSSPTQRSGLINLRQVRW